MRRPPIWTPTRSGIAACIVEGMTEPEIAAAMGCSRKTVQRQALSLQRKLGARNRTHLAAKLGAIAAQEVAP